MSQESVLVTPLNIVGQDERGDTLSFSIRKTENFVYIFRKKGTMSGNTYHTGKSEFTNPKVFVILSGQIVFRYRHIDSKEPQVIEVNEPSVIQVFPNVTHSVEAVSDIYMLECNSIADIQDDRFREEV